MKEEILEFIKERFGTDDLELAESLCSDSSYSSDLGVFVIQLLKEHERRN